MIKIITLCISSIFLLGSACNRTDPKDQETSLDLKEQARIDAKAMIEDPALQDALSQVVSFLDPTKKDYNSLSEPLNKAFLPVNSVINKIKKLIDIGFVHATAEQINDETAKLKKLLPPFNIFSRFAVVLNKGYKRITDYDKNENVTGKNIYSSKCEGLTEKPVDKCNAWKAAFDDLKDKYKKLDKEIDELHEKIESENEKEKDKKQYHLISLDNIDKTIVDIDAAFVTIKECTKNLESPLEHIKRAKDKAKETLETMSNLSKVLEGIILEEEKETDDISEDLAQSKTLFDDLKNRIIKFENSMDSAKSADDFKNILAEMETYYKHIFNILSLIELITDNNLHAKYQKLLDEIINHLENDQTGIYSAARLRCDAKNFSTIRDALDAIENHVPYEELKNPKETIINLITKEDDCSIKGFVNRLWAKSNELEGIDYDKNKAIITDMNDLRNKIDAMNDELSKKYKND